MRISEELLIYDSEEAYVRKLAEVLLLKREITAGVRTCSSLNYMEKLLEKGKIRVLLISDEVPYERRKQLFAGKRIVLTKKHCADLGEEETELVKYQSIDKLAEVILRCFAESMNGRFRSGGSKGRVIGVYSPIHRIGKTTFALKVGKELAEDENVLYLNLEICAGMGGYFRDGEDVSDLSHLLYYTKQESDAIGVRIAAIIQRMGNLDYVPPMKVGVDLRTISVKEWKSLLELILERSIYETILIDMGDSLEDIFGMLQLCDWVFIPYAEDIYSMAKLEQWRYMLQVLKKRDQEQRYLYINMEQSIRRAVTEAVELLKEKEGK